jgi:hypothetical protein
MLRVNGIENDKTEQTGIDRPEKRRTGSCIEIGHNGTYRLEKK